MSTISVLVCTYGHGEWLRLAHERAIPSIQDADEIINVHFPDATIAGCRNAAAADATTEWLCFLDADDEFAPGFLVAMRRALEQQSDGDTLLTPAVQQIRKGRPGPPFFFPEVDLEGGNWLIIGTLIQRELFERIGGFREHPHGLEDWNLWNRAVRAGARVVKVPDAVYVAHMNPQSEHHRLQRTRGEYMVAYEAAKADVL